MPFHFPSFSQDHQSQKVGWPGFQRAASPHQTALLLSLLIFGCFSAPETAAENENIPDTTTSTTSETQFCEDTTGANGGANLVQVFYRDADNDGAGDPRESVTACTRPSGHVDSGGDCNDRDATIFPGAVEVCDHLDHNCDGDLYDGLPGAIFCNNAETLVAWRKTEAGGVLSLSTDSYQDDHAIQASLSSEGADRQAIATWIAENISNGTVFARAYVKVPSSTPLVGLTIFGFNEETPPYEGVAFGISDGNVQLSVTSGNQFEIGDAFVPGRWSCIELEVAVSESGSAKVFVDGVEQVSVSGVNTLPQGGYSALNIGFLYSDPEQTGSVLIDEVAMSRSRIGCL